MNSNNDYGIFSANQRRYVPSGSTEAANAFDIFDQSVDGSKKDTSNSEIWNKFDEASGHEEDQPKDVSVWDKFDE